VKALREAIETDLGEATESEVRNDAPSSVPIVGAPWPAARCRVPPNKHIETSYNDPPSDVQVRRKADAAKRLAREWMINWQTPIQTEKCKGDVVWVTINLWCAGAAEGGCGKGPGARVDDQLAGQAHGVRQRFAP